jgi:hypothetical protein
MHLRASPSDLVTSPARPRDEPIARAGEAPTVFFTLARTRFVQPSDDHPWAEAVRMFNTEQERRDAEQAEDEAEKETP